jgi:hypothetical protein
LIGEFITKVVYIQTRMKSKAMYNLARRNYLYAQWNREVNSLNASLYKSTKSADVKLREKLEEDNDILVRKFLKLYLERCVFMHSLAFF